LTVDLAKVSAFFERISCNVNVYVLPGANDPVNRAYPQRPIHSALLCRNPKQTGSLHSLSNPVLFKVDDFILLGSSGENVHDSLRYASNDVSAIDALERMVHCQHIAPSAPDTLFCFPYQTKDPFLLQKLPHVLFAGNQDACQYRVLEDKNGIKCCLVTIPSFKKTKSVVILNLKDFSCFELAF
jgi:DNA polymerase delta subunit 2